MNGTRGDVTEPGTPRTPRPQAQVVSPALQDEAESPPARALVAESYADLPFVRATQVPGVNVFGEFGNAGAQPFLPFTDRAGFQQHTYVDEGFDADVAVSPDGEWLAFASTRHSPHSDIYLQRVNGLAVTKISADAADDAFPTFSPDGRRIAFCSNRSGSWDIFVMDADGKNVSAVTQGVTNELHPSFSPDGRRLVYCSIGGRSGQWELWVADLQSGERTMIGFGLFPDWSPRRDADVIAFQRARQRGSRWFSLWTLDLIGGEPLNVTEVAVSPNAALVAPAWAPDGHRLTFATVVDPDSPKSIAGTQDIWTVNADGSGRQRLTDGKGVYATPVWGMDGRIYFVSDRGGKESIWSTQADGKNYSEAAVDPGPVTR